MELLNCVVMDCVRLRVQTVPASDPVTLEVHTTYFVMWPIKDTGETVYVPGWTLKDAIDNLCNWFHIDRDRIRLTRPFLPQRMESYDCK